MSSKAEKKEFRVGLLGLGRISARHIESLSLISDRAKIVAVCDSDPQALQKFSYDHEVARYSNLEAMLESEKLDLVSICTPSGLHPAHGITVARRGVNVLVEKPIGVNTESALGLIEACRLGGVKLFVVKQNRFNPCLQLLRSAIEANRFGKLYMIVANVFWTRPQSYYDQAAWRGTMELDGGAFLNQASHYVDIVQWIGGPIQSVQGRVKTLARNIEAEDTGAAVIEFQSGAIGTINVTMLTHRKNLEGSITVLGEKGVVKIGGLALNKIEHWDFADSLPEDSKLDEATEDVHSVYGSGHQLMYSTVFDALEGREEVVVDGNEGLKTVRIIESIYKSARENRTIQF